MIETNYYGRIENLYSDMEKQKMDLLIIAGDVWRPGNIFYTTGWAPGAGGVSQAWALLILKKNKGPELVVGFEFVPSAREIVDKKIKVLPSTEIKQIICALSSDRNKHGKVGIIGLNILNANLYTLICKYIDVSTIFDATNILNTYRRIKTKEELEKIKRSHELTDKAIIAAMQSIREGISEREIASAGMAKIHEMGGLLGFYPTVGTGEHSAFPMQMCTDKKVRENSNILVDFGVNYEGFFSDCTRTAGYHLEDNYKIKMITTCIEAKNEVMKIIRPGLINCEIERLIRGYISDAGFGSYIVHDSGHGIGLDQEEEYIVNINSDTVLEPNMTFTLEPGIYVPGIGGCRIEEMVYVTDNGCQKFSNLKDEWFL